MDAGRFSSLVEAIYDAANDPAGWARLSSDLATAFGAGSCAVQSLDLLTGSVTMIGQTENFDGTSIASYAVYYQKTDILATRMARFGSGQVMLSAELAGEAERFDSEIFNDFSDHLGIFWALGSVIATDRQTLGAIGIHRPYHAPNFAAEDKQHLALLLPHLSRAMLLRRRLDGLTRDRRIALDALERVATGVIAVDADARLLFANDTAEHVLRAGRGLAIRQGRLYASDQDRGEELLRLVRLAAAAVPGQTTEAGGLLTLRRLDGRALSLLISPLPPDMSAIGPPVSAALGLFADSDAGRPTRPQALIAAYGLTPAEARLVAALIDGETLENYADRRSISANTVRTQLKHVFAKTGHRRQLDLIREVLMNPVLAAGNPSR